MKKPPLPPPTRLHQQEPPQPTGPPVPLLHQQEPSQLQPPRPPPLVHNQEPPYQSPPRPPPPLHQQEASQAPRPRGPVITYIPGKPPTSTPLYTSAPNYTSEAFDESPAMETCAELEKTKPRLGFAGDVETTYQHYHHQHRINQRPTNLSPRSSSLWTELTSTFSPQDLEFLASLILSPSTYGNHQRQHQSPTSSIPHCDGDPLKRPRFNLGHDRGIPHSVNDTRTIGSDDYDIYHQRRVQTPPFPSEGLGRFNGVGGMGRPGGDNLYMGGELMPGRGGVFPPYFGPNGTRDIGFGLPPNASKTLFVEGLPSDCSMREVAHIFRPFPGYKEVRLVTKDSKHRNGDRIILCFVDFENPACAATARNALQGYRMDEEERDSKILRIQFSRNPGPRPGQRGGRR